MPGPAWFDFALCALAAWRLTHALAFEDGPFDLIARLRIAAGAGPLGRLMDCPYCLSLWVALPFTVLPAARPYSAIVVWLALSGAVIILLRCCGRRPAEEHGEEQ